MHHQPAYGEAGQSGHSADLVRDRFLHGIFESGQSRRHYERRLLFGLHKFEKGSQEGLYQFIAPTMQTYLATKELSMEYPSLRTPQILHLALALELKSLRLTVVRADQPLLTACRAAGLHVINPEDD